MAKKGASKKDRGVVILCQRSLLFMILGIVVIVVAIPATIFAVKEADGHPGAIIPGVVAVVAGAGFILTYVYNTVTRRRLVIWGDRIELRKGADDVVGQIPFSNLIGVDLRRRDTVVVDSSGNQSVEDVNMFLLFTVKDVEEEDTWWPRHTWAEGDQLILESIFEDPLFKVREKILKRFKDY